MSNYIALPIITLVGIYGSWFLGALSSYLIPLAIVFAFYCAVLLISNIVAMDMGEETPVEKIIKIIKEKNK